MDYEALNSGAQHFAEALKASKIYPLSRHPSHIHILCFIDTAIFIPPGQSEYLRPGQDAFETARRTNAL